MKELFVEKMFRPDAVEVVRRANGIIKEYQEAGYTLTLRQLYYQFVARGLVPNTDKSYTRLGNIISDARLAGLVDWSAIDDLTRRVRSLSHWNSPADIVRACADQYHRNWWFGMDNYVEVWVEKDALIGIVAQSCEKLDVPCLSCRGYVSQTAMYVASKRFHHMARKKCVLLHLGDHDPSGIDMTRDIQDRLTMFKTQVEVDRIALNMDQVRQYNPPPNPAKLTDSRCAAYVQEYGDESWELDALPPDVIEELIKKNVLLYCNPKVWNLNIQQEKEEQEVLKGAATKLEEAE